MAVPSEEPSCSVANGPLSLSHPYFEVKVLSFELANVRWQEQLDALGIGGTLGIGVIAQSNANTQ